MISVLRLIIELIGLQMFCVYVHSFSYYTEFFILNCGDSSDHICRQRFGVRKLFLWSLSVFGVGYVGKCFCSWIQLLGSLWRVGTGDCVPNSNLPSVLGVEAPSFVPAQGDHWDLTFLSLEVFKYCSLSICDWWCVEEGREKERTGNYKQLAY